MPPASTQHLLLVFLGGGLGSLLRFLAYQYLPTRTVNQFPVATLWINIAACLILGVVVGALGNPKEGAYTFWIAGICGGLSTFSTFGYDVVALVQNNAAHTVVIAYILLSIALGIAATVLGMYVGKSF